MRYIYQNRAHILLKYKNRVSGYNIRKTSARHTTSHYSYKISRIFFEDLNLLTSDHHLDVGSGSHADQTGAIMSGVERAYEQEPPSVVLVQGETNTDLAGSLVVPKIGISLGHVEAWKLSRTVSLISAA